MLKLTLTLDDTRRWHVRCGDRTLGSSTAVEFALFDARETARQLAQDTDPLMSQAWSQVYDDLTANRTLAHDKAVCACDDCEAFRDEMVADGEDEADHRWVPSHPWD